MKYKRMKPRTSLQNKETINEVWDNSSDDCYNYV